MGVMVMIRSVHKGKGKLSKDVSLDGSHSGLCSRSLTCCFALGFIRRLLATHNLPSRHLLRRQLVLHLDEVLHHKLAQVEAVDINILSRLCVAFLNLLVLLGYHFEVSTIMFACLLFVSLFPVVLGRIFREPLTENSSIFILGLVFLDLRLFVLIKPYDFTWKILLLTKLNSPHGMCVDAARKRSAIARFSAAR